jgi:hypothetical protein
MKIPAVVTGVVLCMAVSALSPGGATAQWGGRWRGMGAEGGRWGASPEGYSPGSSYSPGGYAAPGGYGAPGGYPPPEASGYPPPSYTPPPYQPPYAYPSRGQSPQQVTTDQSECGTWASQQSGYNPSQAGTAAWATTGGSGPLGTASLGQRVPGLFGGIERREERRERRRERRYEENLSYAGQQGDNYNRALDSCLSARGYTVR